MKRKLIRSGPAFIELDQLIGQGANGCVYSAWRTDQAQTICQRVAVKILNSKNLVDVWRDEFNSLMKVSSPRCVRVFGFEWIEGKPALILELVEGVNLAELIAARDLSDADISYLTSEIHQALLELKRMDLCHGDLSPANVLVQKSGRIKLVDFGFGNTTEGRRLVTPSYASPAVLNGASPTHSDDLWSLGALVFFMSGTHVRPATVRVLGETLQLKREYPLRPAPRSTAKGLGLAVQHILMARLTGECRTVPLIAENSSHRKSWAMALAAVAFLLLARGSSTAVASTMAHGVAAIQVRSNFGFFIELDDAMNGYAPIDFRGIKAGRHKLSWDGPRGRGQRVLTLSEGQNIVIDDDFLK